MENVCVSGVTTVEVVLHPSMHYFLLSDLFLVDIVIKMPAFKRVSGVRLSDGHIIKAETVVNCAGMVNR